jgi:hypothetical protein
MAANDDNSSKLYYSEVMDFRTMMTWCWANFHSSPTMVSRTDKSDKLNCINADANVHALSLDYDDDGDLLLYFLIF